MYVASNPRTKKQLKESIKAGNEEVVYAPGQGSIPENGTVHLEGPHFPEPHKWYATGVLRDGLLIKIS